MMVCEERQIDKENIENNRQPTAIHTKKQLDRQQRDTGRQTDKHKDRQTDEV